MRKWTIISCLLYLLCLGAWALNNEEQAFYFDAELTEHFRIQNGLDTTLQTAEGFQIIISKQTFDTDEAFIDLEIVTAKTKYRMIKNKLITLTTDHQLLESDGMIFF